MKTSDSMAVVDRDVIRRLEALAPAAESQKFVNELVSIFLGVAPEVLRDLGGAFDRKDANAIASHAHRLKSVSLNLGAVRLGHLCEFVEVNIKADPASVPRPVLEKLQQAYAATAHELQNLFTAPSEK